MTYLGHPGEAVVTQKADSFFFTPRNVLVSDIAAVLTIRTCGRQVDTHSHMNCLSLSLSSS